MGNVLISVIALAIMISSVLAVLGSLFDSNTTTSRALIDDGLALSEAVRARVAATGALISGDDVNSNVDVTISNTGNVDYGDFSAWDVSVEYRSDSSGLVISKLPISDTIEDNKWTLRGIYEDAASALGEIVDSGVLNPREEMVLRLRLSPAILADTNGRVVVTPPVGESTSIFFSS